MAGGPWRIDGQPHKFGCFRATWTTALKLATREKRDVFVRFLGPKDQDNVDAMRSDFKVGPSGIRDFSIDPTWKGHR